MLPNNTKVETKGGVIMDPDVIVSKDKTEDTRYHKPSCKWVNNIKRENRRTIKRSSAKAQGYTPCQDCNPG